jgi:hypothetical protein
MFATFDMPVDRSPHFIRRHIFSDDAARDLAGGIDPFDDPARSAPRLADGRRHAAAAHLHRTLGHGFMRLFQGAILFRLRGMADPPSLGNTRVALVTGSTGLFTAHYAAMTA